jgi:O-acetyl-ADP-ribose deacetylase (regulator of RNase III)
MKTIKGDLIQAGINGDVDLIIHQCNCFCTMKSGIAPKIAKAFPWAKEADDGTIIGDRRKLGRYSVGMGLPIIINLYGQYDWRGRSSGKVETDYEALEEGLRRLALDLAVINFKGKIGIPKIGCGLGGGDWSIVKAIIEDKLGFEEVYYYEYD